MLEGMRAVVGLLMAAGCSFHGSATDVSDAPSGSDGGGGADAGTDASPDAPVHPMITVSGTVSGLTTTSFAAVAGATVVADGSGGAVLATTTSASDGTFSLVVPLTNGKFAGHLHATAMSLLDTYAYPPVPLTASTANFFILMWSSALITNIATACGTIQDTTHGLITASVFEGTTPVAGATVSSNPSGQKTCYDDATKRPSGTATSTATDGFAYVFDATPAAASVTAQKAGLTFTAVPITVVAGAVIETLIAGH